MNPPPLEDGLARLLHPGVIQVEGCWLLASQANSSAANQRERFVDQTGYEAFINHIHISDALGETAEQSPPRVLSQAIALGWQIQTLVAPWGAFEIVIAANREAPTDCSVRFYRRRPGESWIERDLEGYGEEGVLVLETPTFSA